MDMLAYDKLVRITKATEAAASAMARAQKQGVAVPLSQYNELADMYNSLVVKYNALYHERDRQKEKLAEWIEYGDKTAARRDELKEIAQNSLRREKTIAEERDALRERARALAETCDDLTAKYQDLCTKGKNWADMWKARAEAAEKELADLKSATKPVSPSKAA
ncbi:hypothetical protein HLH36_16540 [Gluconacetobacter aggeris]|uniref:Uncharacterized protein n=2 Tax=Gluconacetobacter TaxID=89583 RepID=A0A7W4NWK8_9PROT|nr:MULTISPECIES: hypothetical protein [Gluconacetobacter]MBB2166558.1 hypothetical protein [Gluconacetobacter dulcium]MBB2169934.1 hypothetical protein [Gluconacetobacter aggeris]MBB2195660.1 hypothetical protein [Gluconacetobacter dulcium]